MVQTPDGGYAVANIAAGVTVVRPDGARIDVHDGFKAPGAGVAQTRDGRVFMVDHGGTTVRKILPEACSRAVADGLSNPVGLVLTPHGEALLTGTWGDGAIHRIAILR